MGTNEDAQALIGSRTKVVDLEGKMLMPGFHDGHAHVRYGGTVELGCNINGAQTISEIRQQLSACASARKYGPDEWVVGGGWELAAFPEGNPSSSMLDEIFSGRPVLFHDAFGHNAWVSTRALEIAGITSTTPDPAQGVIVRDPSTGQPTGTLRNAAVLLVEKWLPERTNEERYQGLLNGLRQANEFGITAYIEPGVDEDNAALYKSVEERGDLTARVTLSLSPINDSPAGVGSEIFELLAKRDHFRGKYINTDSVKVYIDGVIETQTSTMIEPYIDGSNSPPFYEPDKLNLLYQKLDDMGLQIHTHAIGDGAIRIALDAYENAFIANGANNNRHQIVHLQLIDPADQPRFAELSVAANFQCLWCYPDQYVDLCVDIVGKERVEQFFPVRRMREAGALLVGGSDWDVTSLNPLDAIETAVRRQDPHEESERVLGKNEEIDLITALDMYTRNAAYIMRLEEKTGSIEMGKRADLIVLDRNLFKIPVTEINEAKVLLTLMDGKTVFTAEAIR
ncbi:MAG: amidohydrolase [Gammaproteobacteria bacterium]|nr:amidohydrolase [Gammaproteobacteria bacterium]